MFSVAEFGGVISVVLMEFIHLFSRSPGFYADFVAFKGTFDYFFKDFGRFYGGGGSYIDEETQFFHLVFFANILFEKAIVDLEIVFYDFL